MFSCMCQFCNKEFKSCQSSSKICENCKNRPCEVCGKLFVHTWPYDQKTCSKECKKILINDPKHKATAAAKRDETVRMRYGVSNVNQLNSVRDKISQSKIDPEGYSKEKQKLAEENKKPIIRNCVICGQEFEATGSQTTCMCKHYKNCAVCGCRFEFSHISDKRQTCSELCYSELIKNNSKLVEKVCEKCGKKFTTIYPVTKYCPDHRV